MNPFYQNKSVVTTRKDVEKFTSEFALLVTLAAREGQRIGEEEEYFFVIVPETAQIDDTLHVFDEGDGWLHVSVTKPAYEAVPEEAITDHEGYIPRGRGVGRLYHHWRDADPATYYKRNYRKVDLDAVIVAQYRPYGTIEFAIVRYKDDRTLLPGNWKEDWYKLPDMGMHAKFVGYFTENPPLKGPLVYYIIESKPPFDPESVSDAEFYAWLSGEDKYDR